VCICVCVCMSVCVCVCVCVKEKNIRLRHRYLRPHPLGSHETYRALLAHASTVGSFDGALNTRKGAVLPAHPRSLHALFSHATRRGPRPAQLVLLVVADSLARAPLALCIQHDRKRKVCECACINMYIYVCVCVCVCMCVCVCVNVCLHVFTHSLTRAATATCRPLSSSRALSRLCISLERTSPGTACPTRAPVRSFNDCPLYLLSSSTDCPERERERERERAAMEGCCMFPKHCAHAHAAWLTCRRHAERCCALRAVVAHARRFRVLPQLILLLQDPDGVLTAPFFFLCPAQACNGIVTF
jgi:hypothetical protein